MDDGNQKIGDYDASERWNDENIRWVAIDPNRRYFKKPVGSIRYRPVGHRGKIIGYLWFRDEENAAGFLARDDAEAIGKNAAVAWSALLLQKKESGLLPSRAFDALSRFGGHQNSGRVVPTSATATLPSLDDLKRLAAEAGTPGPPKTEVIDSGFVNGAGTIGRFLKWALRRNKQQL